MERRHRASALRAGSWRTRGLTLTLALVSGCSLAGLADGAGGEDAEGGAGPGASQASTTSTSDALASSSAGETSSQATSSTSGAGGGGGASEGGGTNEGGGVVDSDLFTWAERSGGDAQDVTIADDSRMAMTTLQDGTVVVASVIEEEDDDSGDPRDRLAIVGLRPLGDVWGHTFDVAISRHDGDDGTLQVGGIAIQDDRFAVALTYRGTLELETGPVTATNQDGVILVGTVDEDGGLVDLVPTFIDGTDTQIAQSVAFLDDGDLLVGGRYSEVLGCPTIGVGTGSNRAFVARYRDGECLAALRFGTIGNAFLGSGVRALAVHGDLALAAGFFGGTITLDGESYTSDGATDGFALGLDVAQDDALPILGIPQVFGGDSREVVSAAAVLDDAFVIAGVSQNGDLGDRCNTSKLSNRVNAFVARFALDGSCDWLRAWETDEAFTHGARALAGGDDGLFVAGPFHRISPCDDDAVWSGVATDGFVFRLDPATGTPTHGAWIRGNAEQTATTVAATADALGPMVGGSYDSVFDDWLGEPASVDLYVGALQPMAPLGCD